MLRVRQAVWSCAVTGFLLSIVSVVAPALSGSAQRDDPFTPEQHQYWSLKKVEAVDPPAVRNRQWVRTPVDAFVLAQLEAKHLRPAPRADRITLLRRASLDLIGLPPTPEEVTAFLADQSPKAFSKVVDRLLASPHYGERWGRHWLDLARYAESEGFKADETRPNAWRYRDYVIGAFNADKPYDRFVREQIAGDELWPDDPDARVATAFNRHYPDESNARNLIQRRQEILNDVTDTVGSVFLGLTYGCARCHDHKFDSILQKDYYRLQAFFANMRAADDVVLVPAKEADVYRARLAVWQEQTKPIRERMAALEAPKRKELIDDLVKKYPEEIQSALDKQPAERTPMDWQMYYKAYAYLDPNSHGYVASSKTVGAALRGDAKKEWEGLKSQLDAFAAFNPGELPIGTGIADASRSAPATHVLRGGVYDAPLAEVQPGFLTILDPGPARITPPERVESSGRRTALANWIADPDNPLTARVMVNRIWHYHFGRGLVSTPSNFGHAGERPTHPELLDYLAARFVREGWSIKAMHRLIMNSSAYQEASTIPRVSAAAAAKVDAGNTLLWRFPRQRLEGEIIRDAALAVAGKLNPKVGGPSVFPELPPGMEVRGGWKVSSDPAERDRRSVYVFVRRNSRYPMFESFDMPDTHESCPRRDVTTSPLQALTLLNSTVVLDWAQAFAGRVLQAAGPDQEAQVATAYRLAYSRRPTPAEWKIARDFFQRHRNIVAERASAGAHLAVPPTLPRGVQPVDAATLVDFCHILINSNEFVYRN
ncbi:MAG: hypothetical protein DMF91_19340 [Acidobacteria bacterium]|nr:MAG: hypothetical protein DMF91_19340 [Acidobacteriota bacterium]